MVLAIELSPELEQRLREAARRRGMPVDAYTLDILEQQVPRGTRQSALASLLQTWIDEPQSLSEQQAGEALIQAIDTDRLSDRQLYPPELKGITW